MKYSLDVSNADKIIAALEKHEVNIMDAMFRGLKKALMSFQGEIEKTQLSGRVTNNFGLNRRTGALARSAFIKESPNNFVKLAYASKYIRIHQFGGTITPKNGKYLVFRGEGGRLIFTKKVTIPKRLRILETFESKGPAIIARNINNELSKVLGKR